MIVLCIHIAVIGQGKTALLVQPGALDAFAGVFELFHRQGHTMHLGAVFLCGHLGKTAPAAADLQHALPRLQLQQVANATVLVQLCLMQRLGSVVFSALGIECCRIGHAWVKPQGVKIIAQIVVVGNVTPGATPGVGAQQVAHPVQPAQQRIAAHQCLQLSFVAQRPAKQRHHIGAVPVTFHIALGPADGTATQ